MASGRFSFGEGIVTRVAGRLTAAGARSTEASQGDQHNVLCPVHTWKCPKMFQIIQVIRHN